MSGPEFSVETFTYQNLTHIVAITKKILKPNTFIEIGHVIPAEVNQKEVDEISKIINDAFQVIGISSGVTHTEIKLTPGGPKIVEIGARLGGGHIPELVELALDIDYWNLAISAALGEKPTIIFKL